MLLTLEKRLLVSRIALLPHGLKCILNFWEREGESVAKTMVGFENESAGMENDDSRLPPSVKGSRICRELEAGNR